jgi:hypothetical protein
MSGARNLIDASDAGEEVVRTGQTPSWWWPGSLLRRPTGVHEGILAALPTDRARYTAMGGVVLATAGLAMLSMGITLFSVVGKFEWVIVPAVLVWGLFILGVDSYLMATVTTVWKVIPRIVLAVALGLMIAEGLLLGLFRTAIEERVHSDRAAEVSTLQSNLVRCNPVPGTVDASALSDCGQLILSVQVDPQPAALQRQMEDEEGRAAALKPVVESDAKQHVELAHLARRECNGAAGDGLTGVRGVGLECDRLRTQADDFYTDHKIKENQDQLAQLTASTAALPGRIAAAQTSFTAARDALIQQRLDEVRVAQQEIGLLERIRTLGQLAVENPHVRNAQGGLRLFLVLVDCLPVLLKFMTGFTAYDRRVAARVRVQERADQMANQTQSLANASAERANRLRIHAALAAVRRGHATEPSAGAQPGAELEHLIATRTAQLLRQ